MAGAGWCCCSRCRQWWWRWWCQWLGCVAWVCAVSLQCCKGVCGMRCSCSYFRPWCDTLVTGGHHVVSCCCEWRRTSPLRSSHDMCKLHVTCLCCIMGYRDDGFGMVFFVSSVPFHFSMFVGASFRSEVLSALPPFVAASKKLGGDAAAMVCDPWW